MGFWWRSDPESTSSNATPSAQPAAASSYSQNSPIPTQESSIPPNTERPRHLDEKAEQELVAALLAERSYKQTSSESSQTPDSSTSTQESRQADFEASLYPTELSCQSLFDAFMHCRSPAGHLGHLYRYGGLNPCEDKWSDFWSCMRTRHLSGREKEEYVRNFYRQKDVKKYGVWDGGKYLGPWDKIDDTSDLGREAIERGLGGTRIGPDGKLEGRRRSSEEVWEKRTGKLPPMMTLDPDWDAERLEREHNGRVEAARKQRAMEAEASPRKMNL
ncbi:hypothetical protein K402DRAFT_388383 [Aulographum hederae CBS 113979]|uniref:Uncharacterized protein n=1 Tax=Aulographum hederae CBS 113979 TaxID=1176131 RepID=A0A6G1HFN7_9PEZI|nr:hypothetical protein K402DRAFT_388383 [Aulographum hederae CBS 113979]